MNKTLFALMVAFGVASIAQANPLFEEWKIAAQDRTSRQMVRYLHNEIENNEDIEVIKEARRQINEVYNPMIKLEESVADTVLGKVFCAGCMVAMGYLGYKFVSFIAEENARYYKLQLR